MQGFNKGRTRTEIVLLSNNAFLWLGLQSAVESQPRIRLIQRASHAGTLHGISTPEALSIVIIDDDLESDFKMLISQIKSMSAQVRIILLAGLRHISDSAGAIDFRFDAIVLKTQPASVLIATINHLFQAETDHLQLPQNEFFQRKSATLPYSLRPEEARSSQSSWPNALTERELQIIHLVCQGHSNKDIADQLCISDVTVRHCLTQVFDKVGVQNRQKLIIHAHQGRMEK